MTPNEVLALHNIVMFTMFSQIGIKIDPSEPEISYFVLPTNFMATCPIDFIFREPFLSV